MPKGPAPHLRALVLAVMCKMFLLASIIDGRFAPCIVLLLQLTAIVDFSIERMMQHLRLDGIVLPLRRVGPLQYVLRETTRLQLDFARGCVQGEPRRGGTVHIRWVASCAVLCC